jgi:RNA-directed DNA polymerase
LKCGIIHKGVTSQTEEGTPQGGIISPTLCNIALNGLEELIRKNNPLKRGISPGVHLIRYADDMIVLGKNEEICKKNKEVVKQFLQIRGLELHKTKTKITNIKEGFDFLGFNIVRKPHNPKLNNTKAESGSQKTVLLIQPSEKSVNKVKERIVKIITKGSPIMKIIRDLNPVLRG